MVRRTSTASVGILLGAALSLGACTSTSDDPTEVSPSATSTETTTSNATSDPDPSSSPDPSRSPGPGVASREPDVAGGGEVTTDASGHVVKELGDSGGLVASDGQTIVFEMTVEGVDFLTECPGRDGSTRTPENGSFVVLDVSATLDAAYEELSAAGSDPFMPLTAEMFQLTDAAGAGLVSHSETAWFCFDRELVRSFLDPGTSAEGFIVLDGPADAAHVVFDPDATGGWRWNLR